MAEKLVNNSGTGFLKTRLISWGRIMTCKNCRVDDLIGELVLPMIFPLFSCSIPFSLMSFLCFIHQGIELHKFAVAGIERFKKNELNRSLATQRPSSTTWSQTLAQKCGRLDLHTICSYILFVPSGLNFAEIINQSIHLSDVWTSLCFLTASLMSFPIVQILVKLAIPSRR
jgi:hypothetical protein